MLSIAWWTQFHVTFLTSFIIRSRSNSFKLIGELFVIRYADSNLLNGRSCNETRLFDICCCICTLLYSGTIQSIQPERRITYPTIIPSYTHVYDSAYHACQWSFARITPSISRIRPVAMAYQTCRLWQATHQGYTCRSNGQSYENTTLSQFGSRQYVSTIEWLSSFLTAHQHN